MATGFKSRARRSRRYLTIVKPSGSLHPRVQKVGPEHFGIVAVDCAKAGVWQRFATNWAIRSLTSDSTWPCETPISFSAKDQH